MDKQKLSTKMQILILIVTNAIMGVFSLYWSNILFRHFGLTWRTTPTGDQAVFLTGLIFAMIVSFCLTKRWKTKFLYLVASGIIQYLSMVIYVMIMFTFFWDWDW